MAKKKAPSTHFSIKMDGVDKRILSVRETKDLSLLLSFTPVINLEIDGKSHPLKDEHISVHVGRTEGNLIKQTINLEDGTLIERGAFVVNSKGPMAHTIFAKTAPDMTDAKYTLGSKDGDTLVSLGDYAHRMGTLVYCVTACACDYPIEQLQVQAPHALKICTASFEKFKIAVMYGFMPLQSMPFAQDVDLTTSFPRINRDEDLKQCLIHDDRCEPKNVRQMMEKQVHAVAKIHHKRIFDELAAHVGITRAQRQYYGRLTSRILPDPPTKMTPRSGKRQ